RYEQLRTNCLAHLSSERSSGDLAIKARAAVRLLVRDLPSAIAPDAGRSRPARPVPPWRTRCRPGLAPEADTAQRSPATAHRSPEPRERPAPPPMRTGQSA